eukprot:TRINITY_DN11322_c0_g2_i1.p1 TRINITY_DN11322_c0_g2~~TRINITY_DN11322_c0_g2_i1.p1  ORF type:complete len:805 (+),score=111.30 TRINITY_DN11322_c0_g2_i1:97-2511(+)
MARVEAARSLEARLSRFCGLLTTLRSECGELSAALDGTRGEEVAPTKPAPASDADWPSVADAWQFEPDILALGFKKPGLNPDGTAAEDTIGLCLRRIDVDAKVVGDDSDEKVLMSSIDHMSTTTPTWQLATANGIGLSDLTATESADADCAQPPWPPPVVTVEPPWERNSSPAWERGSSYGDCRRKPRRKLTGTRNSEIRTTQVPDRLSLASTGSQVMMLAEFVDKFDTQLASEWFQRLLPTSCAGGLSAARVAAISRRAQATLPAKLFNETEAQTAINGLSTALNRFRVAHGSSEGSIAGTMSRVRSYAYIRENLDMQQFASLVEWESLADAWEDDSHRDLAWLLRDVLLKHAADEICAEHAQLALPSLDEDILISSSNKNDMIILFIVVINTITMALAADFPSRGLALAETVFVIIYAFEILMRVSYLGPRDFFIGKAALWNVFDLFVTLVSVAEECMNRLSMGQPDAEGATYGDMLRLLRLSRLARMARLFRLGIMSEFRKMVYRIYSGLVPLLWASSVLLFAFFIIAVVLRQTIGAQQIPLDDKYDSIVFESIPWTFFIVFRMFMGDDALPNGTPMGMQLQHRYGLLFTIPYMVSYLMIVFGVFNTITATFVEAVIESSRQSTAPTPIERLRMVQLLRQVLLNMLGYKIASPAIERPTSWVEGMPTLLLPLVRFLGRSTGAHHEVLQPEDEIIVVPFDGTVTFEQFMEAWQSKKLKDLFEELGIPISDPESIFAALDHDYSRTLDTSELVRGLMQLRCDYISRTDVVSTLLGVRSMHIGLAELRDTLGVISKKIGADDVC